MGELIKKNKKTKTEHTSLQLVNVNILLVAQLLVVKSQPKCIHFPIIATYYRLLNVTISNVK